MTKYFLTIISFYHSFPHQVSYVFRSCLACSFFVALNLNYTEWSAGIKDVIMFDYKNILKSNVCLQDASPGGLLNLREIQILAFDTENYNMNLYLLDLIYHCRKTNIFCTSHQLFVFQSLACGFSKC